MTKFKYLLPQENIFCFAKFYLQVSMSYYREKYLDPTFLVVSDDTAWCREHLTADDVRIIGKISATMPLSYIIYP